MLRSYFSMMNELMSMLKMRKAIFCINFAVLMKDIIPKILMVLLKNKSSQRWISYYILLELITQKRAPTGLRCTLLVNSFGACCSCVVDARVARAPLRAPPPRRP